MIDEELYQQAADELNTDNRRAHIWARACALASDDHDEARYLYTNLRVEEMIAERDSGHSTTANQQSFRAEENDSTLALEPLSMDDDGLFSSSSAESIGLNDQDSIPESVSAPSGVDRPEDPDDFLQLLAANEKPDEASVASERAGFEARMEQHFEQQAEFKATDQSSGNPSPENLASGSSEPPVELGGTSGLSVDDKSLEEDFLDSYEEHQQNIKAAAREESADDFISSLDLTDPDVDHNTRTSSAHDEQQLDFDGTTELDLNPEDIASNQDASAPPLSSIHGGDLTDEVDRYDENDLSRDSDELSWLQEEVASNLPSTQIEERFTQDTLEEDRLAQELERQADQLPGQRNDVIEHTNLLDDTQEVAYAARGQAHRNPNTDGFVAQSESLPFNLPVDLTLGERGKEFAIYKRNAKNQAVSTGVSWSALFFTLPFLIYRHLFGTAIMYCVLWIIALGGLLVTGLVWMDAGVAATSFTKACTIGFALLAVIGLLYIPFRYGNIWRGEKLEKRGFELVAWVRASSSGKAVSKARRAAALD